MLACGTVGDFLGRALRSWSRCSASEMAEVARPRSLAGRGVCVYKAVQAVGLGQAAHLGDQVVLHERNIDAAARQLAPEGSHE